MGKTDTFLELFDDDNFLYLFGVLGLAILFLLRAV